MRNKNWANYFLPCRNNLHAYNPLSSLRPFLIGGGGGGGDQPYKEIICSPMSKFFPIRAEPILEGLLCPKKQRKSRKQWEQFFSFKDCLPHLIDGFRDKYFNKSLLDNML